MTEDFQIEDMVFQSQERVVFEAIGPEDLECHVTRLHYPKEILAKLSQTRYARALVELKGHQVPCLRPVIDGGLDPVDNSPWIATVRWKGESLQQRITAGTVDLETLDRIEKNCLATIQELGSEAGDLSFDPNDIVATVAGDGSIVESFVIDYFKWFYDWANHKSVGSRRDPKEELEKLLLQLNPARGVQIKPAKAAGPVLLTPNKPIATNSPLVTSATPSPPITSATPSPPITSAANPTTHTQPPANQPSTIPPPRPTDSKIPLPRPTDTVIPSLASSPAPKIKLNTPGAPTISSPAQAQPAQTQPAPVQPAQSAEPATDIPASPAAESAPATPPFGETEVPPPAATDTAPATLAVESAAFAPAESIPNPVPTGPTDEPPPITDTVPPPPVTTQSVTPAPTNTPLPPGSIVAPTPPVVTTPLPKKTTLLTAGEQPGARALPMQSPVATSPIPAPTGGISTGPATTTTYLPPKKDSNAAGIITLLIGCLALFGGLAFWMIGRGERNSEETAATKTAPAPTTRLPERISSTPSTDKPTRAKRLDRLTPTPTRENPPPKPVEPIEPVVTPTPPPAPIASVVKEEEDESMEEDIQPFFTFADEKQLYKMDEQKGSFIGKVVDVRQHGENAYLKFRNEHPQIAGCVERISRSKHFDLEGLKSYIGKTIRVKGTIKIEGDVTSDGRVTFCFSDQRGISLQDPSVLSSSKVEDLTE